MNGTVLCGVEATAESKRAVEVAHQISERLGLRLVLAHVIKVGDGDMVGGDDTSLRDRELAAALLSRAILDAGLDRYAERRIEAGDVAGRLAQIAAEEAAAVIVIGGRRRGAVFPRVSCRLAEMLDSETPVPVLVALPRAARVRHPVERLVQ